MEVEFEMIGDDNIDKILEYDLKDKDMKQNVFIVDLVCSGVTSRRIIIKNEEYLMDYQKVDL